MYGRGSGGYPEMHQFGHAGGGHPVIWFLFLILLAGLVGFVSAYVLRRLAARRAGELHPALATVRSAGDDALSVVRLRYARGEIDRDNFLQTTADLSGPAPPPPAAS